MDYFGKANALLLNETVEFERNAERYGCTTCIGNSGPLDKSVEKAIVDNDLVVSAVLSGNRNFEGRVHPLTKTNYLASPPLVVAYALAGSTALDITREPLGVGRDGQPVYLKDILPTPWEVAEVIRQFVVPGALCGCFYRH